MDTEKKMIRYNMLSIFCGIIFLLTGWVWTYMMNLFIAYPFGLLGFFLWRKGRTPGEKNTLNITALVLLIIGVATTIGALLLVR